MKISDAKVELLMKFDGELRKAGYEDVGTVGGIQIKAKYNEKTGDASYTDVDIVDIWLTPAQVLDKETKNFAVIAIAEEMGITYEDIQNACGRLFLRRVNVTPEAAQEYAKAKVQAQAKADEATADREAGDAEKAKEAAAAQAKADEEAAAKETAERQERINNGTATKADIDAENKAQEAQGKK